ncbi:MAG: hypothetical protein U5L45_06355 [Saprospiraceae bacterium]|nr:hypothetical protein [Saprospiraceae bacterium]
MKNLSLLFLLCCSTTVLFSQNRLKNDTKGILYNTEKVLDARLYSFGWGWSANVAFGTIKSYNKTTYYTAGLGFDLKHPKEVGKSIDFTSSSSNAGFKKYTYGKQNYATALRFGYGIKRYYSEKAAINGVGLALNFSGGASLALVTPYYLELGVSRTDLTKIVSTKYTPETAKMFLDPYQIRGKSGIMKGIRQTNIVPGGHAKAGVHIDWGAFDEYVRAAEIGIQLDVFVKPLPIIVESPNVSNRPYFLNLYVSLHLGKRN